MADTKMMIMGMSGSGKTCYLLGMYYKMAAGMKGYSIFATDEDVNTDMRKRYKKLCDPSLGADRFPLGTDNVTSYEFELQYSYKKVLSFDWQDYPGGDLELANDGDIERYNTIKKSISESATLFICVDGAMLVGDDKDEKIDSIKEGCSSVINDYLSRYFKDNGKLPPTAIIVTKYDKCADTDEDELCEIMTEAFSPLFADDGSKDKNIVTIIPVSIGKNIEDDDFSGKLKPSNIHLPIFMGIWFALYDKIIKIVGDAAEWKDIISETKNNIRKEEAKLLKNKASISNLKDILKRYEAKNDALAYTIRVWNEYSNKLLDELDEKLKHVYLNGAERTFRDIAEYIEGR